MRHYFLDTNVVIDYLAERQPFWLDAAELMQAAVDGQARLYVASLSFANIYYTLRRATSAAKARDLVDQLEKMVEIIGVDAAVIRLALNSAFSDFEDGIQACAAASQTEIEAIVTRDQKHFAASPLLVVPPADALRRLA